MQRFAIFLAFVGTFFEGKDAVVVLAFKGADKVVDCDVKNASGSADVQEFFGNVD